MHNYVNKLAKFEGRPWGKFVITSEEIKSKVLQLALSSKGTTQQQKIIQQVIQQAKSIGVKLVVIIIER